MIDTQKRSHTQVGCRKEKSKLGPGAMGTPVISAFWEAKSGQSPEVKSLISD